MTFVNSGWNPAPEPERSDWITRDFVSVVTALHGFTSLVFLIIQGLNHTKNDKRRIILPMMYCLRFPRFLDAANPKHTTPIVPRIHAIVWRSQLSAGIHTFMIDQRLSPVNIARNTNKNPIYPQNESRR